ncbi:hypothetical protein BDN72DRAFT_858339 [Pluteus cervinus]|uniref:Uncharacterized protein n=1 Tax=Pluteus cervinus TaxID=181527 RepID=A0ACD3AS56_9AGAR|nr:hypothetical protein BDN72DRAFT_858339 [Pluteus cervinus]
MSEIQPQELHPKKKLILALDGTWQDGTAEKDRKLSTNIWKLARAIHRRDEGGYPQIVYYQSGVGTVDKSFGQWVSNKMESIVDGATGIGLARKVKEAYMFVARNWEPGDEIYIFGFSRGAYTARTVAGLIGDIGLLGKEDMESWWQIYENYLNCGKSSGKEKANQFLDPWRRKREKWEKTNVIGKFTIKVLGVFDTVGALGIPGFFPKRINFFGFNDLMLGRHVENAFHAMSLNENRHDFQVTKWQFGPNYRPVEGQTVKQVWFSGTHSDVGGGWEESDLSIISLMWMADNVKDMLYLDEHFLLHDSRFYPHREWGSYPPHDFFTGIRAPLGLLSDSDCRANAIDLGGNMKPGSPMEMLHPSVYEQNFSDAPNLWPKRMQKLIDDAFGEDGRVAELGEMEKKLKEECFTLERINRRENKDEDQYSDELEFQGMMNRIMTSPSE